MKDESRKKYLLKNTIIFSIGNFGSKIINFFLVPLYTNILTTAEYGTVDLMTVLTTVIVPIITLNISEAVMRFSMDNETKKENILTIGIIMAIISSIISVFLIPIFKLFKMTSDYSILLAFYMLTYSTSLILICYIRGIEKLLEYSIISIIQTAIIAILNIVFLVKFKMGVSGYILAYIIAYFTTIIVCLICGNVKSRLKQIKVDKTLLKDMLKYSALLIPNSLMWWMMNSLDRVMVTSMISVSANGVYAVSYKIPTILTTLTTIFNQAWMFSAVKEKDSEDKNEYTTKVYKSLSICVTTVTSIILVILKPLLKIYVGADFYDAWEYVPPLLLGSSIMTLGTFLSNEYTAHKDSKGFLFSSLAGAILNLILNYLLIPKYGVLGASIATCTSYIIVFIFRCFDTKKYIKIKYNDKELIIDWILVFIATFLVYINKYGYILNAIISVLMIINNKKFWKNFIKNLKNIFIKKRKVNK